MKKLLLLLLLPLAQPAAAFDIGGALRSVANALGGGSEKSSASGTATLGVRGYLGDSLKTAAPNPGGLKTLNGWKATPQDAKTEAQKNRLEARNASMGDAADTGTPANSGEPQ